MDKLQFLIYGAAAYLGLKSLVSLMAGHKRGYERKIAAELAAELAAKQNQETTASAAKTAPPVKKSV